MFSNPEWFRCFHTALGTLFGRSCWFDTNNMSAMQVGFVLQEVQKP